MMIILLLPALLFTAHCQAVVNDPPNPVFPTVRSTEQGPLHIFQSNNTYMGYGALKPAKQGFVPPKSACPNPKLDGHAKIRKKPKKPHPLDPLECFDDDVLRSAFACSRFGDTMCVSWNRYYFLWCDGYVWRSSRCQYYDTCDWGSGMC
jgi:hypothetical protein